MVDVYWFSLNYKDVLVIIGKGKIICYFLMISGIDFVGIVYVSEDFCFYVGQEVLLIGWGVGENYWGGLVECVCVKGDWLVVLFVGLSSCNVMIIGIVGFIVMLCVMVFEDVGICL